MGGWVDELMGGWVDGVGMVSIKAMHSFTPLPLHA